MLETKPAASINWTTKRKTPVWVPATGSPKTRIKKARFYLKGKAWVPADPRDGDKAMLVVVCNLRRYHQLSAEMTLILIQEHYNPRCITADGHSWAWSSLDILKKYSQAGKRGMYPTLGVEDPKAKAKATKIELHRQMKVFWKKHVVPDGCCTPAEVREAFIRFRGGEAVTPNMLSRVIKAVSGNEPVRPFGKKIYRGFHIAETHLGFIRDTAQQQQIASANRILETQPGLTRAGFKFTGLLPSGRQQERGRRSRQFSKSVSPFSSTPTPGSIFIPRSNRGPSNESLPNSPDAVDCPTSYVPNL